MSMMTHKRLTASGSINIPVAIRRDLGLEGKDAMELSVEEGEIRLRAYTPRCVFCGATENVTMLKGKGICLACAGTAYKTMGGCTCQKE